MRRSIAIVILSLGMLAFFQPSSLAQDPSSGARKLTSRVLPVYPDLARRMQLRGTVKVEALVAPNGAVKSTRVIGGNPLLARAAVDAIEKWRWVAAPQDTTEVIELNFHP